MDIEITPKTIFNRLFLFICLLLLANVIGIVLKFYFDQGFFYGLVPLFNFDAERNIPTLYSSFILILSAILLYTIAITHKKIGSPFLPWLGLALIFLFLSIDEIASIHEQLIRPTRNALNTTGLLFFAWVIPYGVALMVFGAVYFRFLLKLPKKIMILFIVSGVTYISGALGFEMISGLWADSHGTEDLIYAIITTCEEFLEMLGIVIFIYTLLVYLAEQFDRFTITIK